MESITTKRCIPSKTQALIVQYDSVYWLSQNTGKSKKSAMTKQVTFSIFTYLLLSSLYCDQLDIHQDHLKNRSDR